jgi:hypothetical protein
VNSQFLEDSFRMAARRVKTYAQPTRDLGVWKSVGHEPRDLDFTRGQSESLSKHFIGERLRG